MKILYIHQYFKTPQEPGITRSYWIARELVKSGHEVTMLTGSDTRESKGTYIDGINVIYLKVPYDNSMNIMQRMVSFTKFMVRSTFVALKQKNIDLVLATSTPLSIGFPALVVKKLKKIPFVFEVRDLWPEVPIQMGGLKNPLLKKWAVNFERSIYKNAKHIIALSPGMYDGVKQAGVEEGKITMIPNMSKIDEFWPRERNLKLCEDLGLKPESFKLIHFGALGMANGAHTVIESAALLKNNTDIEFVFVGGGSTEERLKQMCLDRGLTNVHFLGKFPMKVLSEIVNFCDASMVSFLDIPILHTNSPNKLFDSLSAGKPIIVNSAGWTKDLVETNECGYYVNPHQPSELVNKLLFLASSPQTVTRFGESSRHLACTKFDKSILCKHFVNVINNYGV